VIFLARKIRIDKPLSVKYPVRSLKVISNPELLKGITNLIPYIKGEVNTEEVEL
jgi:hypothetical protein